MTVVPDAGPQAKPESDAAPGGRVRGTCRVLDMINTDRSAKELLHDRVLQVNATGRFENHIYCSGGQFVEWLRARGHTVHVVDTPRGSSPWRILAAVWTTYRLLKRERIDIVHLHGSVIWLVGVLAAKLARTPVVVAQVHGFHHHPNMAAWSKKLVIHFQQFLCALADPLLFQNQADIDECLRSRIAPARKCTLVGNGVQLDGFPRRDPPDNDPVVILCVARLEPVKNHPMLLEAARILRDRRVRFVLNIVGDGHLKSAYEQWVRDQGLSDFVRLQGYRDDVPALTAAADICALVSLKEGLPRAIVEAGVCGRPMVASDVIGSHESIVEGETGFLVPLNDSAALADRLQTLITDREARHEMGRRARAHAETRFDERVVTDRIIEAYDRELAKL